MPKKFPISILLVCLALGSGCSARDEELDQPGRSGDEIDCRVTNATWCDTEQLKRNLDADPSLR